MACGTSNTLVSEVGSHNGIWISIYRETAVISVSNLVYGFVIHMIPIFVIYLSLDSA